MTGVFPAPVCVALHEEPQLSVICLRFGLFRTSAWPLPWEACGDESREGLTSLLPSPLEALTTAPHPWLERRSPTSAVRMVAMPGLAPGDPSHRPQWDITFVSVTLQSNGVASGLLQNSPRSLPRSRTQQKQGGMLMAASSLLLWCKRNQKHLNTRDPWQRWKTWRGGGIPAGTGRVPGEGWHAKRWWGRVGLGWPGGS